MKTFKITLACLSVATFFAFNINSDSASTIGLGDSAPMTDVKMKDVDGESYALADLKKQNGLAVVFSCNTCPFVIGSNSFAGWEKDYNNLGAFADKNDVGMVLINSNEAKRKAGDSFKDMVERSDDKGYQMKYLIDKNSKLADAFGAKTTPHVFLFDNKMKLVYAGSIDNTWDSKRTDDEPYLLNAIQSLANNESINPSNTPPRGCSIKRK